MRTKEEILDIDRKRAEVFNDFLCGKLVEYELKQLAVEFAAYRRKTFEEARKERLETEHFHTNGLYEISPRIECQLEELQADIRDILAGIVGALTQLGAQGNSEHALARAHNLLMSAINNRITDTWLEDAREVLERDSIKENSK